LRLQVVNALPLPALDGGYLALLALEAVRRKKLDQVRGLPPTDFVMPLVTSTPAPHCCC
jgi:membrane-associated protease RseP (regulator of RpoE activity)